jgi:hypothetical protein
MKVVSITLLLFFGPAFVAACSGDNEVDRTLDCHSICSRYAECFDSSFDVEDCRDDCEDEADADAEFEDRVDSCEACIDDASCTEGTFSCTDDCVGVVP